MKKAIIFFYYLVVSTSAKSQQRYIFQDSLSTVKHLNTLSLCEKIEFATQHAEDIISYKGYSILALSSIIEQMRTHIEINSINGNMVVPADRLIKELKERLVEIKLEAKCLN